MFIDEIDVLGARRGSHASHMEYDQTLNSFWVAGIVDDDNAVSMQFSGQVPRRGPTLPATTIHDSLSSNTVPVW